MEESEKKKIEQEQSEAEGQEKEIAESDAGVRSLSEALKVSFFVLKLIIIILVIFFIANGFKTVGSNEEAVVLRFGKMRGKLLKSRPFPYWVYPYPIEEIIKIPVKDKINLDIGSFWYFETAEEKLLDRKKRVNPTNPLQPTIDGYCLVRGEKSGSEVTVSSESDYNIVHCKWTIIYQIDNPGKFFRNIYVEKPKPDEIYMEVIKSSINPLIQYIVESSVVSVMVDYTIDEAMFEKVGRVSEDVRRLVQEKLDRIESGIKVNSMQLFDISWPLQVDSAFLASIMASQRKQTRIDEAETYAQKTKNEAGGPVAEGLLSAIKDKNKSEEEMGLLWSQLAGKAQEKIAKAKAYRTSVVKNAEANAKYLQQMLTEYSKRPQLVIQEIYKTTMEQILENAEEKIIVQPVKIGEGEMRILLNREPTLGAKKSKSQKAEE